MIVFLLMQTLPTLWVTRVWILRNCILKVSLKSYFSETWKNQFELSLRYLGCPKSQPRPSPSLSLNLGPSRNVVSTAMARCPPARITRFEAETSLALTLTLTLTLTLIALRPRQAGSSPRRLRFRTERGGWRTLRRICQRRPSSLNGFERH